MTMARVLMCPPDYFDVKYRINPWMLSSSDAVVPRRARAQWHLLRTSLEEFARVVVADPQPDLPDMCFAANAGLVFGNRFVPSRFLNCERRGEEAHYTQWFERHGYDIRHLHPDCIFEGAGDALFDHRKHLWTGYGQRSEQRATDEIMRVLNVEATSLRLVDPRFYHLDTCFCPLGCGVVVYYPNAFDPAGLKSIERAYPSRRRIVVNERDACAFACNAVDLGDRVLVNSISRELGDQLKGFGISAHIVPLGEFIKSGGSAKCLVLPLTPTKVTRELRVDAPAGQGTLIAA